MHKTASPKRAVGATTNASPFAAESGRLADAFRAKAGILPQNPDDSHMCADPKGHSTNSVLEINHR
jgi:hypothetical protein